MDIRTVSELLAKLNISCAVFSVEPFCSEEDNAAYSVWKIITDREPLVVKKVSKNEQAIYETFFKDGGPVPSVYGFNGGYMVMECVEGHALSRCTREELTLALDRLIEIQRKYWDCKIHQTVDDQFASYYENRARRLAYMEDLKDCYQAYLDEFRTLPRTLCNDDLLPFNVIISGGRAVILDWEFAGILPYPCSIARLLAYGEEGDGALFRMKHEDRIFAVTYYYENLIRQMGIPYEEYLRTLRLCFFKEYSEWIYTANSSGDRSGDYYRKYGAMARKVAKELGF